MFEGAELAYRQRVERITNLLQWKGEELPDIPVRFLTLAQQVKETGAEDVTSGVIPVDVLRLLRRLVE